MQARLAMPSLLLVVTAGAAACGPAIHEARFRSYTPRAAEADIAVYQVRQPECPFEEIGIVSAEKRNMFVSAQDMFDAIRTRAKMMGGDAVIGLVEGDRISGGGANGWVSVEGKLKYTATVVRFMEPDCVTD